MINKRLLGTFSQSKKYIFGNVALQRCSLAANIIIMAAITDFPGSLFKGRAEAKSMVTTGMIVIIAVIVRFICTSMASHMSYLSSKSVKKILQEKIYQKLLRLGGAYRAYK